MRFGIRGFTLAELVIALLIASFIFLGFGSVLFLLIRSEERLDERSEEVSFYEFIVALQRGLVCAKELKLEDLPEGKRLEFLSNYAFSAPFVKIQILINNKDIIYREMNPYGVEVLFEKAFKVSCDVNREVDFIKLSCGRRDFFFRVCEGKRMRGLFFGK
ncbi:MAG: prepilin-type N-terminal cleavage/methylation domain-containing protein [Aquificae bacterium]|nr:prepilin-type N-terminal cleavage/methylation domain-containing protein [Aquificota bacterium]